MEPILISDRSGETSVLLDASSDDHIAVRLLTDPAGYEREVTLPYGSFAWDRAVERAKRGAAFVMMDDELRSAANTIAGWSARKIANGRAVTEVDIRQQVATRWPDLSASQVELVVAACQLSRDER